MNLFLLHLFVRAIAPRLTGQRIGAPAWLAPVLAIPVGNGSDRVWLCAVLESPGPFCFLADRRPLEGMRMAPRLTHLDGATIGEVSLHRDDRIVRIEARHTRDDQSGEKLTLFLHLYGAIGTAMLHRDGKLIESLGRRRDHNGAGTDTTEGNAEPHSIVSVSDDALSFYATSGDLTGERSPQAVVPGLDRPLVAAFQGDRGQVDGDALATFRNTLLAGATTFDLASDGKAGNVVPVPSPGSATIRLGPFDDARAACATAGNCVLAGVRERIVEEIIRPLRRRATHNRKLIANLERDIAKAQGHETIRKEAEILAAFRTSIPQGLDTVELDDIYEPGKRVRIHLDPAESIHVQIEKRFRKATKLEKSLDHANRRLAVIRRELEEIEPVLDRKLTEKNFVETLARIAELRDRLNIPAERTGPRGSARGTERTLRQFDLGPDWFVIVGRSNAENDEVTFHHAGPGDLWFHAQSVPGSHVVLKSRGGSGDNPPAAIIRQAASVAAHYSRSRHSALVPVIYTLRKYVRKFRGAKPGQVKCEREKTVMVRPKLPESNDATGR